jgi:hypothetical protein
MQFIYIKLVDGPEKQQKKITKKNKQNHVAKSITNLGLIISE